MTPSTTLPLLGAALPLDGLRLHRDWIFERQRDLELQDFFWAEVLNGDWRSVVEAVRTELDGYRGRLGVHGPFWGFNIASQDPDIRAVVQKRMMQGLDVCEAVGATQMVIHSPYTTWDYNNLDYNPGGRQKIVERMHDALGPTVRRAEALGLVLVIENIEDRDPASAWPWPGPSRVRRCASPSTPVMPTMPTAPPAPRLSTISR
jgi:hypothetical protein